MQFAPGARLYAGGAVLVAIPAFYVTPWASAFLLSAAGFTLWFYRDPERRIPVRGVVAPADGTVTAIREEAGRLRVGTYMGITDVHVIRAPIGGTVRSMEHSPGGYRPAFSKDSERNERVRLGFEDHSVVLIAGSFARRISTYVDEGDDVGRGDRLGHIAFGSRTDVLLPPAVDRDDLDAAIGDRMRAGETVLVGSTTPRDRR